MSKLAAVGLAALAFASASVTATTPPGSARQVAALVKASVSITKTPANLTPSLSQFTSQTASYNLTGVSMFSACDPYLHPDLVTEPKPCVFGDTSGKHTLVIVGDSNVGNWLPALSRGLKTSGYKLDVLAYSGCPAPDLTYTQATAGSIFEQCNEWHQAEPGAVAALHPIAVIVASGAIDLTSVPSATWTAGMERLFTALTYGDPAAKRILMGTSPYFSKPVPECLSSYSNPQECSLKYKLGSGYYGSFLARDPIIATDSRAKLIPTYKWMCTASACSPVIGSYLVYADVDHVTTVYSDFLSDVATDAVLKVLQK
jgi:hypothetical protein